MPKNISAAGSGAKKDAYHNEYLDTGDLLLQGFMQRVGNPEALKAAAKSSESSNEENALEIDTSKMIFEHVAIYLDDLKADLIALYQEYSTDERTAKNIERMIRKVEKMFASMGIKYELFDPLKMMSGLKSGDMLDNAEKVVANTTKHYKMFGISAIKSFLDKKRPSIVLRIFGEQGEVGFEVEGVVVAKNDFNGNEAIDYVYSEEGGLMTIKARSAGTWVDVTEDYVVDFGIKRYKLGTTEDGTHSVFLGEKIISEGKDQILKVLNASTENLTFGKCRAFSKDMKLIQSLTEMVRVNK